MAGWLVAESVAKAENYMGGTPHIKTYTGRGDTAHTFLMGGTIMVGTPHNIESAIHCYINFQVRLTAGWVAGWVVQ